MRFNSGFKGLIRISFPLLVNDNVEVTNDCLIVKELTPFDFLPVKYRL